MGEGVKSPNAPEGLKDPPNEMTSKLLTIGREVTFARSRRQIHVVGHDDRQDYVSERALHFEIDGLGKVICEAKTLLRDGVVIFSAEGSLYHRGRWQEFFVDGAKHRVWLRFKTLDHWADVPPLVMTNRDQPSAEEMDDPSGLYCRSGLSWGPIKGWRLPFVRDWPGDFGHVVALSPGTQEALKREISLPAGERTAGEFFQKVSDSAGVPFSLSVGVQRKREVAAHFPELRGSILEILERGCQAYGVRAEERKSSRGKAKMVVIPDPWAESNGGQRGQRGQGAKGSGTISLCLMR